MRPNIEMKLAGLFLVMGLIGAACGPTGDIPGEGPVSSTTTPARLTSDSPAPVAKDTELGDEGDSADELGTGEGSVDDRDPATSGDGRVTVQDGTPNESQDPDVPVSDVPAPSLSHPKYPNPEPVIPPPRD